MTGRRYALPLNRARAPRLLCLVLALMAYVAALGAAGLVAIRDSLRAPDNALATTLTLQVPADASQARLRTVMALLHQTAGIGSVRQLGNTETARLLTPWLGPSAPIDNLPVPHLIEIRTGPARDMDLATLRRQLAAVVPQARLEDHRILLDGMRRSAVFLEAILAAALTIGLALIAFLTVFAMRARLAIEQPGIELAHLLGAADRAISRQLAGGWLLLGEIAGILGAGAAFLTILALGEASATVRLQAPIGFSGVAGLRVWSALIGVAAAAGLIAATCARITVRRSLARLP